MILGLHATYRLSEGGAGFFLHSAAGHLLLLPAHHLSGNLHNPLPSKTSLDKIIPHNIRSPCPNIRKVMGFTRMPRVKFYDRKRQIAVLLST